MTNYVQRLLDRLAGEAKLEQLLDRLLREAHADDTPDEIANDYVADHVAGNVPCSHGHFGCAKTEGGACSDEFAARLAELLKRRRQA